MEGGCAMDEREELVALVLALTPEQAAAVAARVRQELGQG